MPSTILPIYKFSFTNNEGKIMTVTIQDLKDYDPDEPAPMVQYIDLKAVAPFFTTEYINNNNDVLASVVGTKATFSFQNTSSIMMQTFSRGSDKRFLLNADIDNKRIFTGYTVIDDNSEPFLAPGESVTITAIDRLGVLRGYELKDLDGVHFRDKRTRLQYLVYCLYHTGLKMDINIIDNLFETRMPDRTVNAANGPWHLSYLDPLTFEQEIDKYEDCNTVLTKLLEARNCCLMQYNGEWWVINMDAYKNQHISYTRYSWNGAILGGVVDDNTGKFKKDIGHKNFYATHFINASSVSRLRRAAKKVTDTFKYEYPEELIRNIEFTRGDLIPAISTADTRFYNADGWTMKKYPINSVIPPEGKAYIKRLFDADNYETERYLVITPSSTGSELCYSERWGMCKNYKFKMSIDVKYSEDADFNEMVIGYLVLYGDDGTTWFVDNDGKWFQSNAALSINNKQLDIPVPTTDRADEWKSFSMTAEPMPRTGDLCLYLKANPFLLTPSPFEIALGIKHETHFSNLSFKVTPFINGTYREYTGETHAITHAVDNDDYSATLDYPIHIADAPCRPFKGALFLSIAGNFVLTQKWQDWQLLHDTGGAGLGSKKFLTWGTYEQWNLNKDETSVFEVELRGMQTDTNYHIGPIQKLHVRTNKPDLIGKEFVIRNGRIDWQSCEFSGTLLQVNDLNKARSYGDNYEYKAQPKTTT